MHNMNRRSLLGAMLAACAAPAFVRAESLMILPKPRIWMPEPITAIQFSGGRLEIFASGTAKTIIFTTPTDDKFTMDAGSLGSGAGFEMDSQNLMAGDVLMTSGAISLR